MLIRRNCGIFCWEEFEGQIKILSTSVDPKFSRQIRSCDSRHRQTSRGYSATYPVQTNQPVSAYARLVFSHYDELKVSSLGSLWPQPLPVTRTTLASLRFHAIVGGISRYLSWLSDLAESKLSTSFNPKRIIPRNNWSKRIRQDIFELSSLRARHNYRVNKNKLKKLPAGLLSALQLRESKIYRMAPTTSRFVFIFILAMHY
jgi:hypothetical protein